MTATQNAGAAHELSPVQKMILDIFAPVYAYLREQGIEYYMLGGTLLGAVRHQGFIPWDDDMDLGIPRGQYEQFLSGVAEVLPPHLKVETFRNTPEHHYYFSRIVDTRYSMRRMGSLKERSENVWIDIFPLDGMPDGAVARRVHMLRLLIVRAQYHISCFDRVNLKRPNRPLSERIVIAFVRATGLGTKADTRKKLEKLDRLLNRYPCGSTGWIVNFMGQYKFREMFPLRVYGGGRMYPFEQYELPGPEDADAVLTQMYGDYMTPPKDHDRNAHAARLEE